MTRCGVLKHVIHFGSCVPRVDFPRMLSLYMAGKLKLETSDFDLHRLMRDLVLLFEPQARVAPAPRSHTRKLICSGLAT